MHCQRLYFDYDWTANIMQTFANCKVHCDISCNYITYMEWGITYHLYEIIISLWTYDFDHITCIYAVSKDCAVHKEMPDQIQLSTSKHDAIHNTLLSCDEPYMWMQFGKVNHELIFIRERGVYEWLTEKEGKEAVKGKGKTQSDTLRKPTVAI